MIVFCFITFYLCTQDMHYIALSSMVWTALAAAVLLQSSLTAFLNSYILMAYINGLTIELA